MLLTQVMSYYFLTKHIGLPEIIEMRFLMLCTATVFVGAGGYIINDYLDIKLDLINKPNKVIVGQVISRRWTMFWHLLFNAIALALGLFIGTKVSVAIFIAAILLWVYSVSLKRRFLVGNLLVSALSAFVIIINFVFDTSLQLELVVAYTLFAFGLTLLREIIKDTEDMRGDGKFNCKTIPIILGVRKTKTLLFYMTIAFTASVFIYTTFYGSSFAFEQNFARGGFIFYMLLFVVFPLIAMLYFIYTADTTLDFKRLSSFTKLIMILGLFSMIFWRL